MILTVPFVSQLSIGKTKAGGDTHDDPTGCWYASACMVGYYFEAGPRFGLPELYKLSNAGGKVGQMGHFATGSDAANRLFPEHHRILAKREHLEPVDKCETSHEYTNLELTNLLKTRGPIFMYWMKKHGVQTYGHASVIIGVEGVEIIYHDPENSPNSRMTIRKFNSVRQKWEFALMQRIKQ